MRNNERVPADEKKQDVHLPEMKINPDNIISTFN